jgi:predicted methyltransferase
MVLTFRNVHNWMKRGYENAIFQAMFDALKPGGVLGLVEHRGDPEVWQDPQALSGYVNQDTAVELAEAAGFRLLASSEVNANPKDARNHPKGVWTLPPSLRLKDRDRDSYLAIGESDRMTLRFVKPRN